MHAVVIVVFVCTERTYEQVYFTRQTLDNDDEGGAVGHRA